VANVTVNRMERWYYQPMNTESGRHVVIGEHFYQPPRKATHDRVAGYASDPSGIDWNRRIAQECYIPQTQRGTLSQVSFDFYATMRAEMNQIAPEQVAHLREAMRLRGVGDPYLHVLLPDLNTRDKGILIQAGYAAFQKEAGFVPEWLWVPETALDNDVLKVAKQSGYRGVLCAPEQIDANGETDNRPVRVPLNGNGEMLVLPFDRPLSSSLAFDAKANADQYVEQVILPRLLRLPKSEPLIAWTDGETFGHHAQFADMFLDYLVTSSLPTAGVAVLGLNEITEVWEEKDYVQGRLRERSAWSCPHGNLQRWHGPCPCDGGHHGGWKQPFSDSLQRLNAQVSAVLDAQLPTDWPHHLSENFATAFEYQGSANTTMSLLAAKASALASLTSCGTFFDNPQTSGRINILFAKQSLENLRDAQHQQLADTLLSELRTGMSQGTDPHSGVSLDQVFSYLLN